MKVIQVNAVNKILSTGRTCSEFSAYINSHGNECLTAYSVGMKTEKSVCISPTWERKLHALMSRISGLQGYFSLISTYRLLKIIKNNKPDIVCLRNLHANYLHLPRLLKYLGENDIATVVILHDCWNYTGKCTHYTSQGCYLWQTGCHNCPKLKDDHNSWLFDRTAKMWIDKEKLFQAIPRLAVVGVSEWITGEARKSPMFKNACLIQRIYNWIDLDVFRPINRAENTKIKKELGIEKCKMILGVASVWSNRKGLDKFIALADKLDLDERIVLIGNMPLMDLPQNILTVTATSSIETLIGFYNAADVFLQLSEEESFGKVVVEALSCGTPVITNNKTANTELVNDSCGIVFGEMTAEKIYESVKDVFSHEKSYYSTSCRKYAETHFAKDDRISDYINIFSSLLGIKQTSDKNMN